MQCAFCQQEYTEKKLPFREECPGCGRDLHICRNCQFYDPGAHHECRESSAENVVDKERANFCEYFLGTEGGLTGSGAGEDARKKLEALFSKK